jgi:hypothetical protein
MQKTSNAIWSGGKNMKPCSQLLAWWKKHETMFSIAGFVVK